MVKLNIFSGAHRVGMVLASRKHCETTSNIFVIVLLIFPNLLRHCVGIVLESCQHCEIGVTLLHIMHLMHCGDIVNTSCMHHDFR